MSTNAEPIIVRIERNLVTLLSGITVANGYEFDASVDRKEPAGNLAQDYFILVEAGEEEPVPDDAPLGCDAYAQTFNLYLITSAPEGAEETVDQKLMKMTAAVRRVVGQDTNYQLGEMAHNFSFGPARPVSKAGNAARELPLVIHYRTLRGNPYQR